MYKAYLVLMSQFLGQSSAKTVPTVRRYHGVEHIHISALVATGPWTSA